MAGKNQAAVKKEGEELKTLFAKVKKKQHNCAVLVAKEGLVVEAHIKKSPEVLLKAAKKAGGMQKGVWGTMTIDGQVIIIDPINEKIPGNLPKLAKKYFSERGLKFRMEIKEPDAEADGPDGAELEEEAADSAAPAAAQKEAQPDPSNDDTATPSETQTDTSQPSGDQDAPDPRQQIEKELAKMQPEIDALNDDTENVMFQALESALRGLKLALEDDYFDRAKDALLRIASVLEDYEGLMAQKRPLVARLDAIADNIEAIVEGDNAEAASSIAKAKREYEYSLSNNEWVNAGLQIDKIEALVKQNGNETSDSAPIAEDTPTVSEPETNTDIESARKTLGAKLKSITGQIRDALKVEATAKELGDLVVKYGELTKGDDMHAAGAVLEEIEKLAANINQNKGAEKNELSTKQRDLLKKKMRAMKKDLENLKNELNDIVSSDDSWEDGSE